MSQTEPKYGIEARIYQAERDNPDLPWRPGELVVMPTTEVDHVEAARDIAELERLFK